MASTPATYPALGSVFLTLSDFIEAAQGVQPFPASAGSAPPLPQLVRKGRKDGRSATLTCQLGKRKPGRRLPGERRKTEEELCGFSITAKLANDGTYIVSAYKPHSEVVHQHDASLFLAAAENNMRSQDENNTFSGSAASSPALSTQPLPLARHAFRDSKGKFRTSPSQPVEPFLPVGTSDEPVELCPSSSWANDFVIPLLPPAQSRYAHRQKRRRPSSHNSHGDDLSWDAWRTILGEAQSSEEDKAAHVRRMSDMKRISAMSGKGALRSWGWWLGEMSPSEDEREEMGVRQEPLSVEEDSGVRDAMEGPSSGTGSGRDVEDSDPDFTLEEPALPPKKRRTSVADGGGKSRGRGRARRSTSPSLARTSRVHFSEPVGTQDGKGDSDEPEETATVGLGLTFSEQPFLPAVTASQYSSSFSLHPGPIRPFDFRPPPCQQSSPSFPFSRYEAYTALNCSSSTARCISPAAACAFSSSSFPPPAPNSDSPVSKPETASAIIPSDSTLPKRGYPTSFASLAQLRQRSPPPPPPLVPLVETSTSWMTGPPQCTPADFSDCHVDVVTGSCPDNTMKDDNREAEEEQALEALLQLGSSVGDESPLLPRPPLSRWTKDGHQQAVSSPVQQQQQPQSGFSAFAAASLPQTPRPIFAGFPSPISPATTVKPITSTGAGFARDPRAPSKLILALPPTPKSPPAASGATASALTFRPRSSAGGDSAKRRSAALAKLPAGESKAQAIALASPAQGVGAILGVAAEMGGGLFVEEGPSAQEVERLRERFWGKGGEQESGPLDWLYQPVNLQVRLNKLRQTDSSFSPSPALRSPAASSLLALHSAYPKPPRHRLPALQAFPTVHASPSISSQLPSADRRIAFALDYLYGRPVSDGEVVFLAKREKALWGYVRVMAGVAEVNERLRAVEVRGRGGRGWMERG
ncbi:hypothetical protein JCM11251_004350 [Rhodosporidiobolus azoricus]